METGLTGRRAIVTGGSRGIGRQIVLELLDEGMTVATCGRDQEALESLVAAAGHRQERLRTAVVDVSDAAALSAWVDAVGSESGVTDVVVSNASALGGTGMDAWKRSVNIDLLAYVQLVEAAAPYLAKSDNGSIVAIGTTAAVEAFGANPAGPYGAIKAAIIHHSSGLARTLAPRGIRSNVVSPGPVFVENGSWAQVQRSNPDVFAKVVASIPRGTMANPADVAKAVVFLASDAAKNITGANLITDGGMTQRVNF